jgi:hypothetical protein
MVNRIFKRRFSYIFSFICTFFEKSADKQYTEKMCYFCGLKVLKPNGTQGIPIFI